MDETALRDLIDAAFGFLCERTVGEVIDVEVILDGMERVLTPTRIGMVLSRLAAPMRERVIAWLSASDRPLAEWLPEPTRDALAEWLGAPAPIPRAVIDEVVTSEKVREAVRAMLHESITSAIPRGFGAPAGGRGERRGGLGRSLFGGIGDEIQRQLEHRVRELIDGGVAMIQARIAQRLASEETARLLGRRRRRAFLELLGKPERSAGRFLERVPHAVLDGLWAVAVPHNFARAEVRAMVRGELQAALVELSRQPIGPLLDELGLRDHVRDALLLRGTTLAHQFVGSPWFAAWLGKRVS